MKTYDFTSKTRELGRVVFALTLDKKRMSERVIIGTASEVKLCLELGEGDVYYDEVRPLGSLLINFESDKDGEWNKIGMLLRESYGKEKILPVSESARRRIIAPALEFLQAKYASNEPSAMFAAIRTWDEYLSLRNRKNASDTLTSRISMLCKPFRVYGEYKAWDKRAENALSVAIREGESNVELWYPVKKRLFETVVISSSFLPLIFYYMNKICEWNYTFQKCKICGTYFLARSRHYELCSDGCRKVQAVTAKREFNERMKGEEVEQLYDNTYQYWYNRKRRLKKSNPVGAEDFNAVFVKFRQEALKRKKAVKKREMLLTDFANWLLKQQGEADRLMGELT